MKDIKQFGVDPEVRYNLGVRDGLFNGLMNPNFVDCPHYNEGFIDGDWEYRDRLYPELD